MSRVWQDVAFPFGTDLLGFMELKEDREVLWTSVINILLTRKGERVFRPEFGSNIPDAVFEPNDLTLISSLESDAQDAIQAWDDRVSLEAVESERDGNSLQLKVIWKNAKDPLEASLQVASVQLTPSGLVVTY